MAQLILASQSPRRQELLASLGVEFDIFAADIDESVLPQEQAEAYVQRLALEKAKAVLAAAPTFKQTTEQALEQSTEQRWVLGSDTAVVVDGKILGKPVDQDDFYSMMQLLSGRSHCVLTAIALVSNHHVYSDCVSTEVCFSHLTESQIKAYWHTGEPLDKAGGYGIQGLASVFIEQITGSYSAVVGLPIHQTAKLLTQADIPLWHGELQLT
ncbi:Maf family protein [Reinekea thalattae]|uniref:dTTP/UTP pyrophosphatase n=1 Tax=Reinekea thalattae TaxID=2593301 RepID=A0A5C8Z7M9_9GAMM|nr:Maf family protein [Reinekea thalattae]TXR53952.1 septum formation inhibitor Maf [Reinekea thalattae]